MPEEAMNAYRHVPGESRLIRINCGQADIEGMLESPENPLGIILFAHGSGSSRLSPRNNQPKQTNTKTKEKNKTPTQHNNGKQEENVLQLNQDAYRLMRCEKRLE